MVLALAALVTAAWAGLVRIGWSGLAAGVAPPLLSGIGALALIAGLPTQAGAGLIAAASAVLVADFAAIMRRQPGDFTAIMSAGAAAWLIGNGLWWSGWPTPAVIPWWGAFLVLTIVGERLELSRLRSASRRSKTVLLASAAFYALAVFLSLWRFDLGVRLSGAGMLAMTLWLWRHDVARFAVRQAGLVRFIGASVLSGCAWLAAAGALAVTLGGQTAGVYYDAQLHALFLGFVFTMIMAHAPIIAPAVTGMAVAFDRSFYAPLVLLNGSLALRVAADLVVWPAGRLWGGMLNVAALFLFFATLARAVRRARVGKT